MKEQWKVVDLIEATRAFFEKKDIASARLDAELLLAHALGCQRIDLYVRFDQVVDAPKLSEFRELVRARGERKPVKQILGRCEFMSREFAISSDVLTPRPETELLVEQVIAALPDAPAIIADIGTGSGAIAISIALERAQAIVYAIDISEPALEVARRNVEAHGVAERVMLLCGDLFAPIEERSLTGKLDCVVSNPPYVAESEFAELMPEVSRYEPRIALVSGDEGLAHIAQIIELSPRFLKPGGLLAIEFSPHTSGRAKKLAEAGGTFYDVRILKDLAKQDRVLLAVRR